MAKKYAVIAATLTLAVGCMFMGLQRLKAQNATSSTAASEATAITGNSITLSSGVVTSPGVWFAGSGIVCGNARGEAVPCSSAPKRVGPPIMLAAVKASAKPIREALAPAAYLQLARMVHLESAATDEIRITDAIRKQGLTVYSERLVREYLDDKADAISHWTRWVWKPLRQADLSVMIMAGQATRFSLLSGTSIWLAVYPHAVPAPALAKVKDLLDELPDALFFVSDYETVKPDPFLAVSTKRLLEAGKVWIIDCWDEPGFGVVPDMRIRRSNSTD